MGNKPMKMSDLFLIVLVIGALFGGGFKGCQATDSGGGNTPAPQNSAVCNEYFKGGC